MAKYETHSKAVIKLHETTDLNIHQICERVGINTSTYFDWKNTKPEFSNALKRAEAHRLDLLTALAREETVNRIKGYTVEEENITWKRAEDGTAIPMERKTTKKHIKASDTLLMYVNNNRDPEHWKHKEHIDHSGKVEVHDFSDMSTDELIEYIRLQKEARELSKDASQ